MPRVYTFDRRYACIARQSRMQLTVPYIHTRHMRCAMRQQAIGKATGALAHIQAMFAAYIQASDSKRPLQLQATARHVACFSIVQQFDLRIGWHIIALAQRLPARGREPTRPRRQQALGLAPAGGQAALHEELIGTHGY